MWDPALYSHAIALWPCLLGAIFFIVFFPFLFQIKGLIGSRGILPANQYFRAIYSRMGSRGYWQVPSLFWINCSDAALVGSIYLGLGFSILLMASIAVPWMIAALYILHLSLVYAGQDFLSFGWEMFLLEIAANTFLLTVTEQPNVFAWISLNLLLFRFHFQGGLVKLQSGDSHWRDLTAVGYHYQSQPLPNTVAWYVHKLPVGFHRFSTALMFFTELIVPFFIFTPALLRFGVWIFFIGLQLSIWFTGNFSYLSYLTVAFSMILLSNNFLSFPTAALTTVAGGFFSLWDLLVSGAALFLLLMQLANLWNSVFFPIRLLQRILRRLYPWHLVNTYGIFAVMTTKRYEIVIEGSDDQIEWQEYLFKYKASEVERRPRRIAPYQPRLDWQMWFLPFYGYDNEAWFQNFLVRLLQGSPDVLSLLRHNPFGSHPPRYIRALVYDYTFSDWESKRSGRVWWQRTLVGTFSPLVHLKFHE